MKYERKTYKTKLIQIISLSILLLLTLSGNGAELGHKVAIDQDGNGVAINFLGELQSADALSGSWNNVTNISPYSVSATNTAKFYRAAE